MSRMTHVFHCETLVSFVCRARHCFAHGCFRSPSFVCDALRKDEEEIRTMPYRATGVDRDSYITGVRAGGGGPALHDVHARRDNLPDNVFAYLKEKVAREQYEANTNEEARARNTIMNSTVGGGKRIAGGSTGDWEALGRQLDRLHSVSERHQAIKDLYGGEWAKWESLLAAKGLAISKE